MTLPLGEKADGKQSAPVLIKVLSAAEAAYQAPDGSGFTTYTSGEQNQGRAIQHLNGMSRSGLVAATRLAGNLASWVGRPCGREQV